MREDWPWFVLLVIALIWLVPALGIFMASIRPIAEISHGWWSLQPFTVTWKNYATVLSSRGIGRAFLTSLIITIPATIIPIFICSSAAYAFAFLHFPGRAVLYLMIVSSFVLPGQVALIPLIKLLGQWRLIDTYLGIILVHIAFCLGWSIFLFKNSFAAFPSELIEAAKMDGCGHFRIYFSIVLPLSRPVLGAMAIMQFLWTWNELLFPLVFLRTKTPLTVALVNLKGRYAPEWDLLSAGTIISMTVPLMIFVFLQRFFVSGLTGGIEK